METPPPHASPTDPELARLEEEERSLSRRRANVHERIGFVAGSGAAAEGQLEALMAEERELAARRKAVHDAIEQHRAAHGLPSGRPAPRPEREPFV
jgi:transposase InsO family protein